MRSIVTDRDEDYIFVTGFRYLANHLQRLVRRTCHKESPASTVAEPVPTTVPHIGASALNILRSSTDYRSTKAQLVFSVHFYSVTTGKPSSQTFLLFTAYSFLIK